MIRSIILLSLGVIVSANAPTTCDVYEQENVPGLCPTADPGKCNEYCKKKLGGELLGAQCSPERPNKQRECICQAKCCNQGCWGDPHCWTCDGVKFGYQGLKKHYMLKLDKELPNIPYFSIAQVNKVWQKGPMAILDVSEVFISGWKLTIELKTPDGAAGGYILKVNDKVTDIPYRFSKFEENRERFVNIVFGNAQKSQVVLTTSFGLRIVYTTNGAGAQRYTDLSIDTPRHPELKNHLHGLLGRWNDNPADDSVDANGVKQKLDDGFSWAFGDSWIVPGGRTKTPDCVREDAVNKKNDLENNVDPKHKEHATKLCKDALGDPALHDCAKKLHRQVPKEHNCVVDLLTIESADARVKYVKLVADSFFETCKRRENQNKSHGQRTHLPSSEEDDGKGRHKHPKDPHGGKKPNNGKNGGNSCFGNLVPLFRMYNPGTDDHFYTVNVDEAIRAIKGPYTYEGVPGYVAVSSEDCTGGNKLKPVYRLYKPGAKDDHFYTQDAAEAERASKGGYTREGIAFYCPSSAPPKNDAGCGAPLAFQRYFRGTDHFYTTSLEEGNKNVIPFGGKHEGVLCYIWPSPGPVDQKPEDAVGLAF